MCHIGMAINELHLRKTQCVFIFSLMFVIANHAFAQRSSDTFNGTITGQVFDAALREPIEYANIVLYRQSDSTQITGGITNPDGSFQLTSIRPGVYFLEVSFIGYQPDTVNNLTITPASSPVNTGNIFLEQTIIGVEGTGVVAERPALAYHIDKKVVNVSRQETALSGTAVDVLENVPSVNVDIEGNVSLRGSENFTVLVDGRPTILESSDALQQIPASTIESIEIITNPSARYDPDGIAGILNVLLKKRSLRGISGISNLNLGLEKKYGGDFVFSYRTGIWNTYIGADVSRMTFPGTRSVESITFYNDTTSYLFSRGDFTWQRKPFGLRGGIDVDLTSADRLSFGGHYGQRNMQRSLTLDYDEWSEQSDERNTYTSQEEGQHSHDYYSLTGDYVHRFFKKNHEISLQTYFSQRRGDATTTNELRDTTGILLSGQQSIEEGPTTRGRLQLDYKLPLRQNDRFEAGIQTRIDRSDEGNELYEYDTLTDVYEFMPQFSHTATYRRDIYAAYSLYSGEWGRFGYQGGLRGEYMYRTIEMIGEDEQFTLDRWDYFPTVHMSYQFSNGQQTMASYTRRIERPRSWWLEPFLTWTDAYNVRTGNPGLEPEYVDSYELGYQLLLGKSLFSTEGYYRITHNKVERVRSTYSENVILHTVENVGTDYALGVEFMLDLRLLTWWKINCTADIFDYRIDGILYGDDFSESDFNWGGRINNELGLSKSTKFQLNGRYRSASVTSQGQREGFFTTDAAIKQEFMGKQLAVTLQVRDIFSTGKREYTSEGADFYYYSSFTREAPVVMLNISYNFNNHKLERTQDTNNQEFEGMEEF